MKPWPALAMSVLMLGMSCTAAREPSKRREPVPGWRLIAAPGSPMAGLPKVNAIGIGDFNDDGRPDLVAINGDPGELIVALNKGEGRFAPPSRGGRAEIGATASGLVVANAISATGAPEVIVCYHDRDEVAIFSATGDGALVLARRQTTTRRTAGSPHVHNLAAGDINRDGHVDVLMAQADDNAVAWALGDGAGGFEPVAETYAAGRHPYTIAAGDFNGDGHLDFAAPNAESNDLTIGLGDGAGRFAPPPGSRPPLPARTLTVAAGDLNGDGALDLVASSDEVQGELALLLGDGRGGFARSGHRFTAPGRCYGQVVADVNGDGRHDVIAPCIDRASVIVWLAEDARALRFRRLEFPTPGTDSQVLAVGDINGDGVADVVTAGWARPTITVLLGAREEG